MKLLRSISEALFWKHLYRDAVRANTSTFAAELRKGRTAEKVIAYYELHGQRLRLTPKEAAYRAVLDFANEYRKEGISPEEEEDLATAIYYSVSYSDRDKVPQRWAEAAHRARASREERRRLLEKAKEAYQQRARVQRDWQTDFDALKLGNPPANARLVWRSLSEDFQYLHVISEQTGVEIGEVEYWAKHFDNLGVAVRIGMVGEQEFRRSPLAEENNYDLVFVLDREPKGGGYWG